MVDGMGAFKSKAYEILLNNEIDDPKAGQWYKLQGWLDSFKEIYEKIGSTTIKVIGMKVPENAKFPPDINSIEKVLASLDVAYQMNHRGGNAGSYLYEKTGNRSGVLTADFGYPCPMVSGIVQALVTKFKQGDEVPSITHSPDGCVMDGADKCKYEINW